MNKYNPTHLLRRADAVFRDAQRRDAEERARRHALAHLHLGRRGAAGIGRQQPGRRASASTSSTASARPSCCTSSCPTRPATSNTAPRAVRCRATRCGWSTKPAPTCADGEVGELLVDAPSAGEGYWNQRSKSRQTFRGPLDPHRRQIHPRRRRPLHLLRPQPTTCSRSPASGSRRSRSRAR